MNLGSQIKQKNRKKHWDHCIYHSEVNFGIDNYMLIKWRISYFKNTLKRNFEKKVIKTGFDQKRNSSGRQFGSFELEWKAHRWVRLGQSAPGDITRDLVHSDGHLGVRRRWTFSQSKDREGSGEAGLPSGDGSWSKSWRMSQSLPGKERFLEVVKKRGLPGKKGNYCFTYVLLSEKRDMLF